MRLKPFIVVLAACGGGPSNPTGGEPSTRIVSSNCQVVGTTVSIDVTYETTLNVGQAWESEIVVLDGGSFGAQLGESSFFTCGFWAETGSGPSAQGCQRDFPEDPATETVAHNFSASFESDIIPSIDVMVFGSLHDSPGGFSFGGSATDQITCF